jgi:hypothetical protein
MGGAARGAAVGAGTSLIGGALGKGVQAIGQRGAAMAQRARGRLIDEALSAGQAVTPASLQQLTSQAMQSGRGQLLGAALGGGALGGLLRPSLAPATAIANIERMARINPEVALAWGSLMSKMRLVNPGRLSVWMNILGQATTPEQFMDLYERIEQAEGTPEQVQAPPR